MKKSNSSSRMPSRSMSQIKIKINTALGNKNLRQVQISKKQQHQYLTNQKTFIPNNRAMSSKSLTQKCMTQKLRNSNQKYKKVPYTYTKNKNIILAHSLINASNHKDNKNSKVSSTSKLTNRPSLASSSIKQQITKSKVISQNKKQIEYELLQKKEVLKKQSKTEQFIENFVNAKSLINQKNVIWFHSKDIPIQLVQRTVSKLKQKNQKQQSKKQHISYFVYEQIITSKIKPKQLQNKYPQVYKQQTLYQKKTSSNVIISFQDCNMSLVDQSNLVFLVKVKKGQTSMKIQQIPYQYKKNKNSISLNECKYVMITNKMMHKIQNPQKILNQFLQLKNDGVQEFEIINKIFNRSLRQKIQQKFKCNQQNQNGQSNFQSFKQFFVLIFQVFPSTKENSTVNKNSQSKKISTAQIIQKKLTCFKADQLTKRKLLFN